MKTIIGLLVLFAVSQSIFAQSKIDQLKLKRESTSNQIKKLADSLKIIDLNIKNEENSISISNLRANGITPILAQISDPNACVYLSPDDFFRKSSTTVHEGTILKVLDACGSGGQFLKIELENKIGYILRLNFKQTPELLVFINSVIALRSYEKEEIEKQSIHDQLIISEGFAKEKRKNDIKFKKIKEEQERVEFTKHSQRLAAKYDNAIVTKILNREIWIGMTSEMAIESWGKPKENNRTIGSWGVHEQWVYSTSNYLYFENGILTSWQD